MRNQMNKVIAPITKTAKISNASKWSTVLNLRYLFL